MVRYVHLSIRSIYEIIISPELSMIQNYEELSPIPVQLYYENYTYTAWQRRIWCGEVHFSLIFSLHT